MRTKALFVLLLLFGLAAEAEARKLHVAVATFSQSVLPLVVAQEKGYFREEDLDVELILMTASVANMALLGGNVDFISTGSSAIGAIFRGAPLKFVFISFNRPMHWLFSRSEIRDVAGLKGRRIGVSAVGGSAHFLVMEILRRHGLDAAREVTVLGIGTTATRYAALANGTIDATNLTPPFNFRAQETGFRELVAYVKQDYLVEPQGAIVVREGLSDPGLMEKFVRATLKGLLHIRQDRASTIPILAKLMKIPQDVAAKIYDLVLPGLTTDGTINQDLQKEVLQFVLKTQGHKQLPATDKIFDFTLAKRLRAELEARKWKPTP
jgi:NitT/TauT family transport system substrate-binding protein